MLGYSYGIHTTNSIFGSVPSTFSMDNVECTGYEASILDCPHSTVENCGPGEGAGVQCSNTGEESHNIFGEVDTCISKGRVQKPESRKISVMGGGTPFFR